jgi:choline-sulfatase
MGCAGNPLVSTPHLDEMAEHGVRFTEAYCNSPLCVPSRMSMMTGRFPHEISVYGNGDSLPSDIPTFAHALGIAGYETVLCGRMHFNGIDQRHGFEKRLVGDITPNYPGGPRGPLDKTAWRHMESVDKAGPGTSPVLEYDDAVVEGCKQFLSDRAAKSNAEMDEIERPLFLTVGLYGPHHPFVSPQNFYDEVIKRLEKDDPIPKPEDPHPWLQEWYKLTQSDTATEEQIREVRANYAGMIGKLDALVGEVVEAVRSLKGETIIVYASDHGKMAGDHGMFWKWGMYEGSTKIPMIWCKQNEEGNTVPLEASTSQAVEIQHLVSLVDLAPTFASIAGAPSMPRICGNDLSVLWRKGDAAEDSSEAFWRDRAVFTELVTNESIAPVRMVRRHQYKLIYSHGYPPAQLFNISTDPREQNDLSSSEDHQEIKQELLSLVLNNWDPDEIKQTSIDKQADVNYCARWGATVGMGPLDLWKVGKPLE